MSRAPLRATAIREEAEQSTPQKKTRLRKRASQRSLLDIEQNVLDVIKKDFGADIMWATDSIIGQPAPQRRMAYEINAWEPVTPDMFGGILDGMFTRKGHKGEIIFNDSILMYRPFELTQEALAEQNEDRDRAMIAQRAMVMNGIIPGLGNGMEAMHPTAANKQTFNRQIKPSFDIPTE